MHGRASGPIAPLVAQSDAPPTPVARRPHHRVPPARPRRAAREAALHDAHCPARRRGRGGGHVRRQGVLDRQVRGPARLREAGEGGERDESESRDHQRPGVRLCPDGDLGGERAGPRPDGVSGARRSRGRHGGASGRSTCPAQQVEDFRAQADLAREQARRATEAARADLEAGLTAFRTTYPLGLAVSVSVQSGHGPVLRARDVS